MRLRYQTADGPAEVSLPRGFLLVIGGEIHLPYDVGSYPLLARYGEEGAFELAELTEWTPFQARLKDALPTQRQLVLSEREPFQLIAQPDLDQEFTRLVSETRLLTWNASAAGGIEVYDENLTRLLQWHSGLEHESRWHGWDAQLNRGIPLGARLLIQPAPSIEPLGNRSRLSPLASRSGALA